MIFSNFLFLILVLLILNMVPEAIPGETFLDPVYAFWCGLGLYGVLLALIVLQNYVLRMRLWHLKNKLFMLVNIEVLFFLLTYHYIFVAHRIMTNGYYFFVYSFTLLLYFLALGIFYVSTQLFQSPFHRWKHALHHASLQIRFLIPFIIPFVLFSILIDLLNLYPNTALHDFLYNQSDSPWGSFLLFLASMVFIGIMMIFLPAFIQWIWGCEPLHQQPLKQELEDLCQRAHFKHAGMKIWTIFNQSMTAAIIGIVPRFRYVMFTKGLLNNLPNNLIVAILAHEIGHSYRKHLLIFPFILFGMIIAIGLFSSWFTTGLVQYLNLKSYVSGSDFWASLSPFAVFVPFAIIMALYFRYIFGYFSRIFERQADLHCFLVDVPTNDMIDALDKIAIAAGHSHHHPSWHHYSIQQRMDFLRAAEKDSSKINRHHKRVKRSLWIYLVCLITSCLLLFAPFFNHWNEQFNNSFNGWITSAIREKAADKLIGKYQLTTNDEKVRKAITNGLKHIDATAPGVAEYYTARTLYHAGDLSTSMTLMTGALKSVNTAELHSKALILYRQLAFSLLKRAKDKPELASQTLELEAALYAFQKKTR